MSVSLVRSLKIINILANSHRAMTPAEIANELSLYGDPVSSDLVNRDLRGNLLDYIEVTEKPKGRKPGEYELSSNWMPPIPQDAISVLIAQQHLKYLLPHLGKDRQFSFQADQSKRLLSHQSRKWVDKVHVAPVSQQLLAPEYNEDALSSIYDALLKEKVLQIEYWKRSDPEIRHSYTLHPHGLLIRGGMIYLLAICDGYDDIRQFACNRVAMAATIDTPAKINGNFNIKKLVQEKALDYVQSNDTVQFEARFKQSAIAHLYETPLTKDQVIERDSKPGWFVLKAELKITEVLRWWLLGFADNVEVLKPVSFRNEIAQSIKQAADLYQS